MLRSIAFAFTLVVISGCLASPVDPTGQPSNSSTSSTGGTVPSLGQTLTGGTRLKVQYAVGTDGSRKAIGFFDSQRNEACSLVGIAGGGVACLPGFEPTVAGAAVDFPGRAKRTINSELFSDPACTVPVAGVSTSIEQLLGPVHYFVVRSATDLRVAAIHPVGAREMIQTWRLNNGPCVQSSQLEVYRSAGEVPLTEFVAMQLQTEM